MAKEFYIGRRNCAGESLNAGRHSYGNGTFRPRSVSAILFGRNVPENGDVSAKKHGRFAQEIWKFRPRNRDVSAKKYGRFGQEIWTIA